MRRFIVLTCLMFFAATSSAVAQKPMEDVVYLKNGGVVRGTIIESIPDELLKLKTRDGNALVYTMDEVAKTAKEAIPEIRKQKNPWAAFWWSFLVPLPGAGQFYNEQNKKGWGLLSSGLVGLVLMSSAFEDNGDQCSATFNDRDFSGVSKGECENWVSQQERLITSGSRTFSLSWTNNHDYDGDDGRGGLGALLFIGVRLWSIIDAPIAANKINNENQHGHLLEFGGRQVALEVNPMVLPNGGGARMMLHF